MKKFDKTINENILEEISKGDYSKANILFENNISLVDYVLNRYPYIEDKDTALSKEDIRQELCLELYRCIFNFNPNLGGFANYIIRQLEYKIKIIYRDRYRGIKIPRYLYVIHSKVCREILFCRLEDRDLNISTLAKKLNVTEKEIREAISLQPFMEFEKQVQNTTENGKAIFLKDTIQDEKDCFKENDFNNDLEYALNQLENDEKYIIQQIYFKERTQKEIALELEVTQSWVSRKMKRGLNKLKEQLICYEKEV